MNNNFSILIAVPTNDGQTIFPKMLGMARYFCVYSTNDGKIFRFIEKRINLYEKTYQHLKTLDVYYVIRDCKIIISASIGKKGIERLRLKGIKLYFRNGNITEALKSIFSDGSFEE